MPRPRPPVLLLFFSPRRPSQRHPHSFPTRRSSDLIPITDVVSTEQTVHPLRTVQGTKLALEDRSEDTRLNSSHRCISYAVFCLKKKKSTLADSSLLALCNIVTGFFYNTDLGAETCN